MPPSTTLETENSNPDKLDYSKVTTLIFDIDDTLYDVGTGFTAHRNGKGATSFMVAKLNFKDEASAKLVRDEYFEKYHSTAKALTVAEDEGKLPLSPSSTSSTTVATGRRMFNTKDLAQWWATKLNFDLLGGPNPKLIDLLKSCPLNLIAFSNGPRLYVLRVLKELGLDTIFPPSKVFAVDDVLPYCKPEKESFDIIMKKIGVNDPRECIMVEDSMKNIRAAKKLGMGTVLVAGIGRLRSNKGGSDHKINNEQSLADAAEATKPGDAPDISDNAVDHCIESVDELQSVLPFLWKN